MHELADDTPLKYKWQRWFQSNAQNVGYWPTYNKINVQDKKIHNPVTNLLLQCYEYKVYSVQLPTLLKLHSRCSSGTR